MLPMEASDISPLDSRPLSVQAREALLAAIRGDRFPDGKLPPEGDLAEMFGVSRTTIRAALQSLKADGYVSRRRRHGTQINARMLRSWVPINHLVSFAALIEKSGYKPSVLSSAIDTVDLDAAALAALDLSESTVAVSYERVLCAGSVPVITVTDLVPVANLTVPLDAIRSADTTPAFLTANAHTIEYAASELVPLIATSVEPRHLDLEPGTPYLRLNETHHTREHIPFALSVVCVNDSYVRLSLLRSLA